MIKKTKIVGKLLLQTSVRELYNDLIKSDKFGGLLSVWKTHKVLVSDTALRYLMPREIKNSLQDISKCVDVKLVFIANNCNVPYTPGEKDIQIIKIVINLLSFLMELFYTRQQDIL